MAAVPEWQRPAVAHADRGPNECRMANGRASQRQGEPAPARQRSHRSGSGYYWLLLPSAAVIEARPSGADLLPIGDPSKIGTDRRRMSPM